MCFVFGVYIVASRWPFPSAPPAGAGATAARAAPARAARPAPAAFTAAAAAPGDRSVDSTSFRTFPADTKAGGGGWGRIGGRAKWQDVVLQGRARWVRFLLAYEEGELMDMHGRGQGNCGCWRWWCVDGYRRNCGRETLLQGGDGGRVDAGGMAGLEAPRSWSRRLVDRLWPPRINHARAGRDRGRRNQHVCCHACVCTVVKGRKGGVKRVRMLEIKGKTIIISFHFSRLLILIHPAPHRPTERQ